MYFHSGNYISYKGVAVFLSSLLFISRLKFKVLNWNFHSFRLLEIIQVLDSISWVRCASGNVCSLNGPFDHKYLEQMQRGWMGRSNPKNNIWNMLQFYDDFGQGLLNFVLNPPFGQVRLFLKWHWLLQTLEAVWCDGRRRGESFWSWARHVSSLPQLPPTELHKVKKDFFSHSYFRYY